MKLLARLILAALVILAGTALFADEDDPPGRVARLQYVSGSVSVQPEGTGDWVEATLNRPLTNSDNIWTDQNARAELNVGTGYLRMNGETSLTLTNINDNTVQVQVHQGTVSVRIRKLYGGEIYEIDTPNMAFTVQKSGEYRFDVDPNGDASYVTVWKGAGDATGDGPAVRVREHQRVRFSNGTSLAYDVSPAPSFDGFDDWGHVRDRRQGSISARYVSPGVIGYEDLDDYGYWRVVPTYGSIWVPRHVAVGWAPYRFGHWVWVGPWGWTWIDDAPWGFAPYHYGRWVYTGGYWGWAPGPIYVRPVYAPALVAWFGGPHWGVGLSFGGGYGYGWCPLGWNEPFIPWYRGSRRYFHNVNITNTRITNVTVINNYYGGHRTPRYANLRSPGGMTAVPERAVRNSMRVDRVAVKMSPNQFERASLGGRVDLTPDRNSRLGAARSATPPPQRSFERPTVSRMSPPNREGRPEFGRPAARPETGRVQGRHEPGGARNNREAAVQNAPRPGRQLEPGRSETAPARTVPRPPERNRGPEGVRSGARVGNVPTQEGRGNSPREPAAERNAPRPPDSGRPERSATPRRSEERPEFRSSPRSQNAPATPERGASRPSSERSTPRPPENSGRRNADRPDSPPRNNFVRSPGNRSSNSYVPRPTGRVLPAASYRTSDQGHRGQSRNFSANSRDTYGSAFRSGGRERSYTQAPRYSPPAQSWGGRGSGAAPSYRSFSGSSYRGYSAPPARTFSAPADRSSSGFRGSTPASPRGGGFRHR